MQSTRSKTTKLALEQCESCVTPVLQIGRALHDKIVKNLSIDEPCWWIFGKDVTARLLGGENTTTGESRDRKEIPRGFC